MLVRPVNARPSAVVWVNGMDIVVPSIGGEGRSGVGSGLQGGADAGGHGECGVGIAVLGAERDDAGAPVLGGEVGVAGGDQEVEVRMVLADHPSACRRRRRKNHPGTS